MQLPAGVDTIFHVAASGRFLRSVREFAAPDLENLTAINLISPATILARALQVLPVGGRYCYVSSLAALLPSGGWYLYGATKAAMDHVVRSMRATAFRRGISLTIAYPGVLDTEFHDFAGAPSPAEAQAPELIAEQLIQSVERRDATYIAPMDRAVIEERIGPDRMEVLGRHFFPELEL